MLHCLRGRYVTQLVILKLTKPVELVHESVCALQLTHWCLFERTFENYGLARSKFVMNTTTEITRNVRL